MKKRIYVKWTGVQFWAYEDERCSDETVIVGGHGDTVEECELAARRTLRKQNEPHPVYIREIEI
jgi:hypothetical protein